MSNFFAVGFSHYVNLDLVRDIKMLGRGDDVSVHFRFSDDATSSVKMDSFHRNQLTEKLGLDGARIIPAPAGYFAIYRDGDEVWKRPILAFRISLDAQGKMWTEAVTDDGAGCSAPTILRPDGSVFDFDTNWPSEAAYLAEAGVV